MTRSEFDDIWEGIIQPAFNYKEQQSELLWIKAQRLSAASFKEAAIELAYNGDSRHKPALRTFVTMAAGSHADAKPDDFVREPMTLAGTLAWAWIKEFLKVDTPQAQLDCIKDYMGKRQAANCEFSDSEMTHINGMIEKLHLKMYAAQISKLPPKVQTIGSALKGQTEKMAPASGDEWVNPF